LTGSFKVFNAFGAGYEYIREAQLFLAEGAALRRVNFQQIVSH